MHRQSLTSPASKHGIVAGAGAGIIKDDNNINKHSSEDHRKEKLLADDDDEENQSEKLNNQTKSMMLISSSSFRFIHLIPLLTLFCFIILYLASHDPSGKDLAQFGGFTTLSSKKNIIDSSGLLNEKDDISAIGGSTRNLQQQLVNRRFRSNRRYGN